MNKKIYLIIDYRDQFYFSTRYRGACVDINRLKILMEQAGIELIVRHYSEINFRNENYKDKWIIYQSSEDSNLFYKDYIEDVLFGFYLQGAKLIPDLKYFRAHHNKVFMEILRDLSEISEIKNITSKTFGTFEEYKKSSLPNSSETYVLKPGMGTRSRGVHLMKTKKQKISFPKKISKTYSLVNLKFFVSKLFTGRPYTPVSNHRNKFIIQNFVAGLGGDFRILAYGEKFYVVYRKNRDNNFTASGSGKIDFDTNIPNGLLDFAKNIYKQFDLPFMSMDIGNKDGKFFLFEFQCLCLGQYTLEKSKFYYYQNDNKWEKVYETPDLEREIVLNVLNYIKRKE